MMNNEITAYDIIADAVREYINNTDGVIDYAYIVSFEMSYNPVKGFKKYTEIVYYNNDGSIDFEMDFCEGEKYVVNINILPLYKVGEFMTECKYYSNI